MSAEKVVKFNQSGVYDDIEIFLKEQENYSVRTRQSYETNIRQFFEIMKNKDIEHLTEDDLVFKRNEVLKFRQILVDRGYENTTINQKVASVKSLYDNLKANDYKINSDVFHVKRLPSQTNSYGVLSQTEADRMAETVFITEKTKPYTKYCLILFATRTSFRLDEILKAKWNDLVYKNGVYEITLTGKRQKERTTAISEKLYNKLLGIKEENKKYKVVDEQKIFNLSKDSINDMMGRLRTELNISEERNITFHSFRKVAIDWTYETEGAEAALEHSGHSDYNTMIKHYTKRNRDYSQAPGVKMDEEMCWDFLENVDAETFKEFFKQQGSYKLYTEIKKFVEGKS